MKSPFQKALSILVVFAFLMCQMVVVSGDSDNEAQAAAVDLGSIISDSVKQKVQQAQGVKPGKEARIRAPEADAAPAMEAQALQASDVPMESQSKMFEVNGKLSQNGTIPNSFIVKYKNGTTGSQRASVMSGITKGKVETNQQLGFSRITMTAGSSIQSTIQSLRSNPNVQYVEPVYTRSVSAISPDDEMYTKKFQWGLQAVDAASLWSATDAAALADITIAVVDTGVDLEHPDLAGSLVAGYDFVNQDSVPDDDYGHGTHVAGIAAALPNNGGITGVAGGAKIMPVKVLNSNGEGTTVDIVNGILFAANNGARIINLSFGSAIPSMLEEEAIQYAVGKGIVVVAAVGNGGADSVYYPAAYTDVIGVGAVDWNGGAFVKPDFSNSGNGVDLVAPGVDILSTVPMDLDTLTGVAGDANQDGYAYMSGTSMATPFVSGMLALLLAQGQDVGIDLAAEITANALKVRDLGVVAGLDTDYGYGMITGGTLVNQIDFPQLLLGYQQTGVSTFRMDLIAHASQNTLYSSINGIYSLMRGQYDFHAKAWIDAPEKVADIPVVNGIGSVNVNMGAGSFVYFVEGTGSFMDSNCQMIYRNGISGTVSLPDLANLPDGTVLPDSIQLYVDILKDGVLYDWTDITLNAPNYTNNFSFTLPSGEGYQVRYYVKDDLDLFVQTGYYEVNGTVWDYELADSLDLLAGSESMIDLTLIRADAMAADDAPNFPAAAAGEASLILPGTMVPGVVIDYTGDTDFFQLVIGDGEAGWYSIVSSSDFDSEGYLYGSDFNLILMNTEDAALNQAFGSMDFLITSYLDAGTYYLKVKGFDDAVGNYSLKVYKNSDMVGTVQLPAEAAQEMTFNVEAYALDAEINRIVGNSVVITIAAESDQAGFTLAVPETSGYLLGCSITSSGSTEYVPISYYKNDGGLDVTVVDPSQATSLTIPGFIPAYTLTIPRADEIEDDFANAPDSLLSPLGTLVLDTPGSGSLNYAGDVDCFTFSIQDEGDYVISSSLPFGIGSLYDFDTVSGSLSNWLVYKTGDDIQVDILQHLLPGDYLIKVNQPFGYVGTYTVAVSSMAHLPAASQVTITGEARVDTVLTGSYQYSDLDDGAGSNEGNSTFRWLSSDTVDGTYAAIDGATGKTYTTAEQDIGKYLKFEVTPVSTQAPFSGAPLLSAAFGPVAGTDGDITASANAYPGAALTVDQAGQAAGTQVIQGLGVDGNGVTVSIKAIPVELQAYLGLDGKSIKVNDTSSDIAGNVIIAFNKAGGAEQTKTVTVSYSKAASNPGGGNPGGGNPGGGNPGGGNPGGGDPGGGVPGGGFPGGGFPGGGFPGGGFPAGGDTGIGAGAGGAAAGTPNNGKIELEPVVKDNGEVEVELDRDLFKELADSAEVKNGVKTLVIEVRDSASEELCIEVPAAELASDKADTRIEIVTGIGTVVLPSNMFEGTAVKPGQKAGIVIGKVDKSELSPELAKIVGEAPIIEIHAVIDDVEIAWNKKDAPVTLTIPYMLKPGENPDNITVFYMDGSGKLENVQGIYNRASKTVTFTTTHFSKYIIKENKLTFKDLKGFEADAGYIESMAAKGIIAGVGNDRYAPGMVLTRAQFASLLVKMLKIDISNHKGSAFKDVKATDPMAPYINAAYKAGLILGVGGGKFAPNVSITRQDAASILVRALKYKGVTITDEALDGIKDSMDISKNAAHCVGFTVKKGIISLNADGKFDPKCFVNRATAARYIYNTFFYTDKGG